MRALAGVLPVAAVAPALLVVRSLLAATALAGLAPRYRNDVLGDIVVNRKDGKARFDVGAFSSEVATQLQPDGSLAFVTIDPVAAGFQFMRADKDGMRKLVVRDGQHEYVFDEVK